MHNTRSPSQGVRRYTGSPLRSLFPVAALILFVLQFGTRTALANDVLDQTIYLNLAANTTLESALIEWGTKAGCTLLMNTQSIGDLVTKHEIRGSFSAGRALALILEDTELSYTREGTRVRIVPTTATARLRNTGLLPTPPEQTGQPVEPLGQQPLLTAAREDNDAQDVTQTDNSRTREAQLSAVPQVIVTARKQTERLQDVPLPVSVIQAQTLVTNDDIDLRDYYSTVPGLSLTVKNGDQPIIVMRGISTGGSLNPTVSTTIDDAPYGSSTFLGGGGTVIDLDPSDLERVEILRGPQGTLYGASSMGGLIRFVTTSPSVSEIYGRVSSELSGIYNSNGYGYNMRAIINVPLGDSLAILLSAYNRHEPGYIDDIVHGINGFNTIDSDGGRLSLLWQPTDKVSLKLNAIRQIRKSDGLSVVDTGPGAADLTYSYHVPQLEGSTRDITFFDGVLNAMLGDVDVSSISSYTRSNVDLRNSLPPSYDPPVPLAGYSGMRTVSKFTQEIRASLPVTKYIDWLLGVFYTHEAGQYRDVYTSADQLTGAFIAPLGDQLYLLFPTTYREAAFFTTATFKFGSRFDVQIGGRESSNWQSVSESLSIGGTPLLSVQNADSHGSAFTYLFTPRFKFSENLMMYARIASGYRPGGPNYTRGPGVPDQYAADTTRNYEVGFKGTEQMVSVDASLYRVDWRDIQLNIHNSLVSPISFIANGGLARSQGVELSLDLRPISGLSLSFTGAYSDAILENIPVGNKLIASPGDRLPFSCRFCGTVAADYQFSVWKGLKGRFGASANYVGNRYDDFTGHTGLAERPLLPSYTQVDIHAGISSSDGWNVNAFVNNLTDQRAILATNSYEGPPVSVIIRPRTIGISVSRDF